MTFKTPMPEKIEIPDIEGISKNSVILAETLDQLIDVVAELREVVEGKTPYKQGYEQGRFDAEMDSAHLGFKEVTPYLKEKDTDDFFGEGLKALIEEGKTPSFKEQLQKNMKVESTNVGDGCTTIVNTLSLKEQLLDAIRAVSFHEHELQRPRVQLEDVESIINKLMP